MEQHFAAIVIALNPGNQWRRDPKAASLSLITTPSLADTIDRGDRNALDGVMGQTESPAAELLSVAVENFALCLSDVVDRFLACPEWQDTELMKQELAV